MSHPSPRPARRWWIAALTGPVVWVLAGPIPVVWAVRLLQRYEDQGPPVALAAGIAVTIAIEAIALPTVAITAWNPTSRLLRAAALAGHVALVLASLLAWTVVRVDRLFDVLALAALTAVSATSAAAWHRARTAPRTVRAGGVGATRGHGGG